MANCYVCGESLPSPRVPNKPNVRTVYPIAGPAVCTRDPCIESAVEDLHNREYRRVELWASGEEVSDFAHRRPALATILAEIEMLLSDPDYRPAYDIRSAYETLNESLRGERDE